ncbi:MAG: hypothetical protein HY748_11925 [Elusimicrobia bacterium]|nr:hypothetical protein [Elusimicrobiota bacterium]
MNGLGLLLADLAAPPRRKRLLYGLTLLSGAAVMVLLVLPLQGPKPLWGLGP